MKKIILIAAVGMALVTGVAGVPGMFGVSAASAQDKVALKLELPKPLFVGTPRPIQVPNLEALSMTKDDFMVPVGTVKLSANKTVTSSDNYPVIGELTFLTDGEKKGTDGTYVELGPGTQWVQIDLGAPAAISAVALWHFHSSARVYHDVVVQVADDAKFTQNVRTLYSNDADNSTRLSAGTDKAYIETNAGRIIDGKGSVARYVRFYSSGNTTDDLNHYVEAEVYGIPAK